MRPVYNDLGLLLFLVSVLLCGSTHAGSRLHERRNSPPSPPVPPQSQTIPSSPSRSEEFYGRRQTTGDGGKITAKMPKNVDVMDNDDDDDDTYNDPINYEKGTNSGSTLMNSLITLDPMKDGRSWLQRLWTFFTATLWDAVYLRALWKDRVSGHIGWILLSKCVLLLGFARLGLAWYNLVQEATIGKTKTL